MKKLFILPIILILASCNCKKATTNGNEKMGKSSLFEVLSESQYQGREEQAFEVIKDEVSLKELYQSVNNEGLPDIDFKTQRVVAVFLGQRNSGGYAIKISNAYEKEGKIFVEVTKISPQPGQNLTMALTNPYSVARINSTKEIVFVEK